MLASLQTGWKTREPRRTVLIPSRMQVGAVWVDACIHNMSSRGMMLATDDPPAPGTYVDIRRGTQVVIGRVMWRKDRFFGIRTQDRLDLDAIVNEPRLTARPQRKDVGAPDRRSRDRLVAEARIGQKVERSRQISMLMQFVVVLALGAAAAVLIGDHAYRLLAAPSRAIEGVLAPIPDNAA